MWFCSLVCQHCICWAAVHRVFSCMGMPFPSPNLTASTPSKTCLCLVYIRDQSVSPVPLPSLFSRSDCKDALKPLEYHWPIKYGRAEASATPLIDEMVLKFLHSPETVPEKTGFHCPPAASLLPNSCDLVILYFLTWTSNSIVNNQILIFKAFPLL